MEDLFKVEKVGILKTGEFDPEDLKRLSGVQGTIMRVTLPDRPSNGPAEVLILQADVPAARVSDDSSNRSRRPYSFHP